MTFSPPKASDIRWVLTVPAIWTDESKAFMREAAYRVSICIQKYPVHGYICEIGFPLLQEFQFSVFCL